MCDAEAAQTLTGEADRFKVAALIDVEGDDRATRGEAHVSQAMAVTKFKAAHAGVGQVEEPKRVVSDFHLLHHASGRCSGQLSELPALPDGTPLGDRGHQMEPLQTAPGNGKRLQCIAMRHGQIVDAAIL